MSRDRAMLPQRARSVARFGSRAKLSVSVQMTSGGILATGALISAILLSTAALVRVSRR